MSATRRRRPGMPSSLLMSPHESGFCREGARRQSHRKGAGGAGEHATSSPSSSLPRNRRSSSLRCRRPPSSRLGRSCGTRAKNAPPAALIGVRSNKKAEQPASEKAFVVEVSSSSAIEQPVFESNVSGKTLAEIREEADSRAKAAEEAAELRTSGVRRLLRHHGGSRASVTDAWSEDPFAKAMRTRRHGGGGGREGGGGGAFVLVVFRGEEASAALHADDRLELLQPPRDGERRRSPAERAWSAARSAQLGRGQSRGRRRRQRVRLARAARRSPPSVRRLLLRRRVAPRS